MIAILLWLVLAVGLFFLVRMYKHLSELEDFRR